LNDSSLKICCAPYARMDTCEISVAGRQSESRLTKVMYRSIKVGEEWRPRIARKGIKMKSNERHP
jgi:hypothetical protein